MGASKTRICGVIQFSNLYATRFQYSITNILFLIRRDVNDNEGVFLGDVDDIDWCLIKTELEVFQTRSVT